MPVLFEAKTSSPKRTSKKSQEGTIGTTPLTAFVLRPMDVRFETQGEDEEVILFLRQHIIIYLPKLIIGIVFLVAPVLLFPFVLQYLESPIEIPAGYVIIGTVFWYVATCGFIFTQFLAWFFNIFIVTNERIIDIDFLYLLYKKFAEAQISRIQDISFRTSGIMATMFNYGDVLIQTASELPNFIFESVPRPADVVEEISRMTDGRKKKEVL